MTRKADRGKLLPFPLLDRYQGIQKTGIFFPHHKKRGLELNRKPVESSQGRKEGHSKENVLKRIRCFLSDSIKMGSKHRKKDTRLA